MEPSNVRKLSPEDRDKLVLQLEREEADLTERDYDRYQELIKQDLSGLTAKKIIQSLLALLDTLQDGLLFVLGFVLLVLVVTFLNGHLDQAWPYRQAMLRLQVSVDAMVRVQAEIAQRPVALTRLASYLYEYGFQRLLAEEEQAD